MEADLLRFPHKAIRAQVIKKYIEGRYDKVVCFSCGNAAAELHKAGVKVLHIGRHGILEPHKWFSQAEIAETFPNYFDATSGHLPMELMLLLSAEYRAYLGELPPVVYLPCGSGETLLCLKLAYNDTRFVAVYDIDEATEYDERCVLNPIVELLADKIIHKEQEAGNG